MFVIHKYANIFRVIYVKFSKKKRFNDNFKNIFQVSGRLFSCITVTIRET